MCKGRDLLCLAPLDIICTLLCCFLFFSIANVCVLNAHFTIDVVDIIHLCLFYSLGIIYGVFSFSNLLAPTVVTVIGPKFAMFVSGLLYSGYIAVFIVPVTWAFYFTSALIGVGAALLWTAQGHFLVENSEASTINRNTGMFWALLQCRYGPTNINVPPTLILYIRCTAISLFSTLKLHFSHFCLGLYDVRPQKTVTFRKTDINLRFKNSLTLIYLFIFIYVFSSGTILELVKSKTILLLSPCMAYSGLELSFYSGVYGTCIGATAQFGDAAKGLIGISGIVVGIGEIVGGGFFGLLCKNNRFRRTSVVFLGMVVHFVAFYLIFLNIPDDAPVVIKTNTQKNPYLSPR
uniref:Major facilitator superfamily domain containing 11 n=1 Tax=Sphaeramia orbicularis TaxID=375764 RepID=A0A672YDB3_9TELE